MQIKKTNYLTSKRNLKSISNNVAKAKKEENSIKDRVAISSKNDVDGVYTRSVDNKEKTGVLNKAKSAFTSTLGAIGLLLYAPVIYVKSALNKILFHFFND